MERGGVRVVVGGGGAGGPREGLCMTSVRIFNSSFKVCKF